MADLENMKVEDLVSWYRLWYAPNNAVLVVVGDVQPDRCWSSPSVTSVPFSPETIPQQKARSEPRQRGVTRVTVRAPAREPYLIFGFKTPVVGTSDEVWGTLCTGDAGLVLDGGGSARFSRNLVRGGDCSFSWCRLQRFCALFRYVSGRRHAGPGKRYFGTRSGAAR